MIGESAAGAGAGTCQIRQVPNANYIFHAPVVMKATLVTRKLALILKVPFMVITCCGPPVWVDLTGGRLHLTVLPPRVIHVELPFFFEATHVAAYETIS